MPDAIEFGIRLPPEYKATIHEEMVPDEDGEETDVVAGWSLWDITFQHPRRDACDSDDTTSNWAQYDTTGAWDAAATTREELARRLVTAILVDTFHETIEFLRLDGKRMAMAHVPSDATWEWMTERFEKLVAEYLDTFSA